MNKLILDLALFDPGGKQRYEESSLTVLSLRNIRDCKKTGVDAIDPELEF